MAKKFIMILGLGAVLFIGLGGSLSVVKLFVTLALVTLAIKTNQSLEQRAERMKVFEKNNIPFVPDVNIISGNFYEMYGQPTNLHTVDAYHKKIGETFGTYYGPDAWTLTTDLDLVKKVFNESNERNIIHSPYKEEWNETLMQVRGEEWRKLRQALNPTFSAKRLKSPDIVEDIEEISMRFINGVDEMIVKGKSQHATVGMLHNAQKLFTEAVFKVLYGQKKVVNLEPTAREPMVDLLHYGQKKFFKPLFYGCIMFSSFKEFIGQMINLVKFVLHFTGFGREIGRGYYVIVDCLNDRKKYLEEMIPADTPDEKRLIQGRNFKAIDALIELHRSGQLDDRKVMGNMVMLLIGGFETTANTLTTLLWLLAKHPHVQEKLREAVIHESDEAEYLDWCIKETLRLYPAAPAGIGRIITETFEHKGMTFRKGTSLLASVYSIHHSPKYWGEDCEHFRPERWAQPQVHPAQFMAFGTGSRRCIGNNLAQFQIRTIIAHVLPRFRVDFCDSTPHLIPFTNPNIIHTTINCQMELKFIRLQ